MKTQNPKITLTDRVQFFLSGQMNPANESPLVSELLEKISTLKNRLERNKQDLEKRPVYVGRPNYNTSLKRDISEIEELIFYYEGLLNQVNIVLNARSLNAK